MSNTPRSDPQRSADADQPRPGRLGKIVSGGQSGVDRAALDAALALGVPCGGWCPKGRRAEDGPIPGRYPLAETPSDVYAERTAWNVRDSDGTLILARGPLVGGTALTERLCAEQGKPCRVVDLSRDDADDALAPVADWLRKSKITILNVAGPRESTAPGITAEAERFLTRLLSRS